MPSARPDDTLSRSSTVATVTLPYYDAPLRYLDCALKSVLSQTCQSWRAVVIDDSPRGSSEVQGLISGLGDRRVTYLRNDFKHGIGPAWNAALDAATTELVCILHTDDELAPEYLSEMIRLAEDFPKAAIYFCAANVIGESGEPVFSLPDFAKGLIWPHSEPTVLAGESGVRALAIGDFVMCPTMVFRKDRLAGRRFSHDHRFVLDYRFLLEALFGGESIVGTHKKLYRYRRHSGQATVRLSISGHRFQEELATLRWIAKIAGNLRWKTAVWAATLRPTFRLNVIFECLRAIRARRRFWPTLRFLWA